MNMTMLDWWVVGGVMALFLSMAYMANRLSTSVSDYLVAGRCAGRYMLTVASGTEWIGAIHIVAMFQIYYKTGLNGLWWVMLTSPILVYLAISGLGIFRFRETRAMTLSQFLEMRYSPGVRIAAGVVTWVTGVLNFAIFPAVSAKVMITLLGLPKEFALAGMEHIPTFPVAAAFMLIIPSFFVLGGGHTTVIITDFIQGMFMNIIAVVIVTLLLFTFFHWDQVVEVLKMAPAGASKLDPIHTSDTKDFNAYFFLINIIAGVYGVLSNVPSQGFMGSGKNAHEQRMGQLLGQLRWQGLLVFFMVIALVATVILNHPAHRETAAAVNRVLDSVSTNTADESRSQAMVAAVLPHILPVGVLGLFGAVLLAALISCHTGFMHAWGSVMLQDIIMPFRKKPFETRQHIWALRIAIIGVCLIVYALSLLIKQQENILMYFAAVNSIWLGPAGALMLGGLYWSRGTKRGAVVTMTAGVVIAAGFIFCQQLWPSLHTKYPQLTGRRHAWELKADEIKSWQQLLALAVDGRYVKETTTPEGVKFEEIKTGAQAVAAKLPQPVMTTVIAGRLSGQLDEKNRLDLVASLNQVIADEEFYKSPCFGTADGERATIKLSDGQKRERDGLLGVPDKDGQQSKTLSATQRREKALAFNRSVVETLFGDAVAVRSLAFPINGQWCFFINICLCVAMFVLVSLTDKQPAHDMDKLLNRGKYAKTDTINPVLVAKVAWYERIFGITPMFNLHDKITAYAVVGLFLCFFVIFCIGMLLGFTVNPSLDAWAHFWHLFLLFSYGVLIISTTWLGIGGIKDLISLVKGMRSERADAHDDGFVGKTK